MDLSIEDEDVPPPFFLRRSTWLFGVALLVAIGLFGWWLKVDSVKKNVTKLVQSNQYDQALAKLHATQGWLGDCDRYELLANLYQVDEREDSLLLKIADSLRTCRVAPDSLLQIASLGNLRISKHATGLDSSAVWTLQSNAFTAASHCVKADSGNKACRILGFKALVGMNDTYAQVNWIADALARWPDDSAFLQMGEEARRANLEAKAVAQAGAVEPVAASKKATKPDKKKSR